MRSPIVRIVTTTDLIGSIFPQRTSYGGLAGGGALARTVQELSDHRWPTVWIDTGDLTQGNPLGPLTDGVAGFVCAASFDIDAVTLGNHELDWGLDHLQTWAREFGCPVLAANGSFGFAATTMLERDDWTIGVLGLTQPQLHLLHPEHEVDRDPVRCIRHHAKDLTRAGADIVVLALHDGVDLGVASGGPCMNPTRMARLCEQIVDYVDVVLGGHTLGRHVGKLGGVSYVQPWPLGREVGVADVHRDGTARLSTVEVRGPEPWRGFGARAFEALAGEIVGELGAPLANQLGGRLELGQLVADGLVGYGNDIDLALLAPLDLWNQPPCDGVLAHLPAGPVSRAQILRLLPQSGGRSVFGGQLLMGEVDARQVPSLIRGFASSPQYEGGPPVGVPAVAKRDHRRRTSRVAIPAFHRGRADSVLRSDVAWRPIEDLSLRDGLIAALEHPT